MNWLEALLQQIRSAATPTVQTEALAARATEIAAICDGHVPQAPSLQFSCDAEDQMLEITWHNVRLSRTLTVVAELDGTTVLLLLDTSITPGKVASARNFTGEQLKTSVISFFDGWAPPS